MIGLEVLFKGNIYKARSKNRSLSLCCNVHDSYVDIYFSAFNKDDKSIERWLVSSLELNEVVVVKVTDIKTDSTTLKTIPEETKGEMNKRKEKAITNFRLLENYLKANEIIE